MKPFIFEFPQPSPLGQSILQELGGEEGKMVVRSFPDKESYLRVFSLVKEREVIIHASLFPSNEHALPLLFLCEALRDQGAKRIGLLIPYLPYMRQDKIFHPGEALTSKTFASLLSAYTDYIITVDPHLHRYHSLHEIYSIPSYVVKAAPLISQWILENVKDPFLIGPDQESEQWVKEIAKDLPYLVLQKVRNGDQAVEISWPAGVAIGKRTPVLVDDIISSGVTMVEALKHLQSQGTRPPLCVTIHPLFVENAYQKLLNMGAQGVISCNSLPHFSNQIDLAPLLASTLKTIVKEEE